MWRHNQATSLPLTDDDLNVTAKNSVSSRMEEYVGIVEGIPLKKPYKNSTPTVVHTAPRVEPTIEEAAWSEEERWMDRMVKSVGGFFLGVASVMGWFCVLAVSGPLEV